MTRVDNIYSSSHCSIVTVLSNTKYMIYIYWLRSDVRDVLIGVRGGITSLMVMKVHQSWSCSIDFGCIAKFDQMPTSNSFIYLIVYFIVN